MRVLLFGLRGDGLTRCQWRTASLHGHQALIDGCACGFAKFDATGEVRTGFTPRRVPREQELAAVGQRLAEEGGIDGVVARVGCMLRIQSSTDAALLFRVLARQCSGGLEGALVVRAQGHFIVRSATLDRARFLLLMLSDGFRNTRGVQK